MARVSLFLIVRFPAVPYLSPLVSSVDTSSVSKLATPLDLTLVTTVNTSTTVSGVPTTPPTMPRTVPSRFATETTRTSPASTPIQVVRSRPTLNPPSLWVPLPPCHTNPRSPLLPTALPTPRRSSTALFPPQAASHPLPLVPPAVPAVPGPPVDPVPPTLLGAAAVLLSVSRSDPLSSPWVSVPLALCSPSSPWLKLGQQIYHRSIPSQKRRLQTQTHI